MRAIDNARKLGEIVIVIPHARDVHSRCGIFASAEHGKSLSQEQSLVRIDICGFILNNAHREQIFCLDVANRVSKLRIDCAQTIVGIEGVPRANVETTEGNRIRHI
jgi:hypothetical protein